MAERISVSLPEDLVEELNDELEYGDSRSAWIADAIRMKLDAEADEGNSRTPETATAD